MNLAAALSMAEQGRLYPSVILHGGDVDEKRKVNDRRDAAVALARRLLCAEPGADPLGTCAHCRRIHWPGDGDRFHPDFMVLRKDLKTVTSTEVTREFLLTAQVAPFEARGQVFVIAAAETLSDEAANALLTNLEEPHLTAPRHFLLLAPSQFDLLPTLRSRSLALYLGAGGEPDERTLAAVAESFDASLAAYGESRSAADLLAAAGALAGASDWLDPLADEPWIIAAAAARRAVEGASGVSRRRLLDLSMALLEGQRLRLRGLPARRILEGLVVRHLGAP
jgi:DNA polymerase III delta prime subunit